MAIARGAGTEIIRSIHLEDVNDTARIVIVGEQHHIYTVLSVIVMAYNINAAGDFARCYIEGYDSLAGSTAQIHYIFGQDMQAQQTFVWNDKFSFNGFEPTDFAGPVDDATKQDAIADQGSSVAQKLYVQTPEADNIDVWCTFIDQNNS